MALKFLNKKGWHTGSLRNIEIVWKAEQKHEAEQRKLEELKKQIEDEREKQEFRLLQEQAGLVPKQERLEFLYDSGLQVGRSSNTTEDYLLGKPIEETKTTSEVAKVAAAPGALFVDEKPESANDKWRKLHTDPLLLIRQQEQAALARIKNNPIKMDMIKKSIKEKIPSKEKKRKHKDKKKKDEEEKKKRKKQQQHDDSDGEVERGRKEARIASTSYMSDREDEIAKRRHQSLDNHDEHSGRQYARSKTRHDSPESGNESPWGRRGSCERRHKSPKRRYASPERRRESFKRQRGSLERWRGSPERRHGSPERRRESLQTRHGSPERWQASPRWRNGSSRKRDDTPERRHDSPKRRTRHDSPESPNAERSHARVRENEEHPSNAGELSEKNGLIEHQKAMTKQPGRKLTEEEKAARLKAMQEDAEVHEEQRWHRLKKASDADRLEEAKRSSGRNFLDQTARTFYGAAQGGSVSVEESVRRRSHFIERSLGDSNVNTFQRS